MTGSVSDHAIIEREERRKEGKERKGGNEGKKGGKKDKKKSQKSKTIYIFKKNKKIICQRCSDTKTVVRSTKR